MIRTSQTLHLAACQAGTAWLVIETDSGVRIDTVSFSVTEQDLLPPFNIELVFLDPFTSTQKAHFEQAAAVWEAIIETDIPDHQVDFDSRNYPDWWAGRRAYLGELDVQGLVDDLRVLCTLFPMI